MGLTKQYLRYVPAGTFNIVASPRCKAVFVTLQGQEGRFVAVAGCEHVLIWDLRLGEKAQVLPGEKAEVTSLAASPDKWHLSAGYSDGTVQVYDLRNGEVVSVFAGHRSSVTSLVYDTEGHRLASGSNDTDIIVWDTVAETGLCRLGGHKGVITQLCFMSEHNILISCSKDTFVKFWDLDTQYCFKTLVGHRSEIWGLTLLKQDKYLITGTADAELQVWKITFIKNEHGIDDPVDDISAKLEMTDLDDFDDKSYPLQCIKAGLLLRSSRGRVMSLVSDVSGNILACHGTDKCVDLYYFYNDEEANKRLKKRRNKQSKKLKSTTETNIEGTTEPDLPFIELSLNDEVRKLPNIESDSKHRVKSVDLVLGKADELRAVITLANNTIELFTLQTNDKGSKPEVLRRICNQGHGSDVRAICFSSDNLAIATGSAEAVKLWNRPSQACLRTVETGYILSCCFVPGDRHLVAGLKTGSLVIIDIAAGIILEEVPAHSKELWSVILLPDLRGCVTGGGDNTVKFWKFELIEDPESESKAKVLSLLHTRTLKLEESVLCVRVSPDNKFVVVALLDSTVKIFFLDTFKFYISLYGHKLPVLCMDISSDSTLIVTGSADRNIKIWGMDFGDCHRSLFAHDDSVTGIQFVPNTHQFFSCGKDGKVKHWDADSYAKIITLQGHVGEAWGLSVSANGQFVVSCGADRVLRLYERSEEPLVLQDAAEEEREALDNAALATGEETTVPGRMGAKLPSKKTVGSEKAAESILECLEVSAKYQEELNEHAELLLTSKGPLPVPQAPPLMLAYQVNTPQEYFIDTIKRIRASDLNEALILLPFSAVCDILKLLPSVLKTGKNQIELLGKLAMFLLRIHHGPIVSNHTLIPVIKKIEKLLMKEVSELRDMVGFNLYGLQYLQREVESSEGIQLFRDATKEVRSRRQVKKQREKRKRSFITLAS